MAGGKLSDCRNRSRRCGVTRNTRTNKLVEYKGERKPLAEWAEILGMSRVTLGRRLRLPGWSVERAFTEPVDISQRRVRAIPDNAGVTFRLGQPAGDRVIGERPGE